MASSNEIFGSKGSSKVTPTYSNHEGGHPDLSYTLEMTVQASVQNVSQRKLEKMKSHMIKEKGYDKCDVYPHNNTIWIQCLGGLNVTSIMKYIQKHIDPNASKQQ